VPDEPLAPDNLLEVRGLKKYFPIHGGLLRNVQGYVKAVDFSSKGSFLRYTRR
jgi:hypothetical protein